MRITVTALIVVVAAVALFGATRGSRAVYTFEAELARIAQPTGKVLDKRWIRIREDGAHLRTEGMYLLPFIKATNVVYPDWRSETCFDLLPIPVGSGRAAPGQYKAERNCVLNREATVLGMEQVDGYEAVVIRFNVLSDRRLTFWEVPELGCETLRMKEEVIQPDGSTNLVAELKPVWIRKGQ